jgi:transcriptional regulator
MAVIESFVRDNPFAILASRDTTGISTTHAPLVYERHVGENGRLIGHMARVNTHWQSTTGDSVAIFAGVHTYISSSWYEKNDAVPTWNYVAVHMHGPLRILDSADDVMMALKVLSARLEPSLLELWQEKSVYDSLLKQSRGVVAFAMDIVRIDAKWKMSQNRSVADQRRVVEALRRERSDDDSLAVADLIEARLQSDLAGNN